MKRTSFLVIFITASKEEEAKKIADALLTQKKAACVNIVPKVNSQFWWQGKIDTADETLLIVKTKDQHLDNIIKLVKSLHSYDVPEIIALPIAGGNKEYLDWITKEV